MDVNFSDIELRALRQLNGEFGYSKGHKLYLRAMALMLCGTAMWAMGMSWWEAPGHVLTERGDMWSLIAVTVVMAGTGIYLWWNSSCRLRLEFGRIQSLAPSGRTRWEASLMDLESVATNTVKGRTTLRLQWQGRSRVVMFPDSFELAMQEKVAQLEADGPQSAQEEDTEVQPLEIEPAVQGGAWRCPQCGEENPGTFGVCWKCERGRETG